MEIDKLKPHDSRAQHLSAHVRGKTYGYLLAEPTCAPVGTVVLIHGFPDISFGWRYQIPHLLSLGYRVVAPDALGYGSTDAPQDVEAYATHNVADDIAALARHVLGPEAKITVGGHDMGGQTAWLVAARHPNLVVAVFSVCTPILEVSDTYTPLRDMIAAGKWTHFAYQLQFEGPEVEQRLQGADGVRQFLNALYLGSTAEGDYGISIASGVDFDILPKLRRSPLLSEEELEYYVEQYMLREAPQLRGPMNWYRVVEHNWKDGFESKKAGTKIEMPALLIVASSDAAVPPSVAEGIGKIVTNVKIEAVNSGHWALCQAPAAVNEKLEAWLTGLTQQST